jgi:hypothetical protein
MHRILSRIDKEKTLLILVSACLAFSALAIRLALVYSEAAPYPIFPDEHLVILDRLVIPYGTGGLIVNDLLKPHNEHYCYINQLINISMLIFNGQWTLIGNMIINNVIFYVGFLLLSYQFIKRIMIDNHYSYMSYLVLILIVVLPFGFSNALWAIQSDFYLLLMFTILTFSLISKKRTVYFFSSLISSFLCFFSISSGLLTTALSFLFIVSSFNKCRSNLRIVLWFGVLMLQLILYLNKGDSIWKDAPYPQSFYDAFIATCKALAWPYMFQPLYAIFSIFNIAVFCSILYYDKEARVETFWMLLMTWVILQAISIGIIRGKDGREPYPRYQDLLTIYGIVQLYMVRFIHMNTHVKVLKLIYKFQFLVLSLGFLYLFHHVIWHRMSERTVGLNLSPISQVTRLKNEKLASQGILELPPHYNITSWTFHEHLESLKNVHFHENSFFDLPFQAHVFKHRTDRKVLELGNVNFDLPYIKFFIEGDVGVPVKIWATRKDSSNIVWTRDFMLPKGSLPVFLGPLAGTYEVFVSSNKPVYISEYMPYGGYSRTADLVTRFFFDNVLVLSMISLLFSVVIFVFLRITNLRICS